MKQLTNDIAGHRFKDIETETSPEKNRVSEACFNSIKAILRKPDSINKLFFRLTKKLDKFFFITKAALVVHSKRDNKLKAIAMKGNNGSREGLTLTLPNDNSLLYKVFDDGKEFIQNYPQKFEGNFIEEKMLLSSKTSSVALLPIKLKDSIVGLICFSSPIPYAFALFENGALNDILSSFGQVMKDRLPPV